MRKTILRAAAAAFLLLSFCVQTLAFPLQKDKLYLAAINTDTSGSTATASFNTLSPLMDASEPAEERTGGFFEPQAETFFSEIYERLPEAELLATLPPPNNLFTSGTPNGFSYEAGVSRKTVTSSQQHKYDMLCLCVGTHCTVWGSTENDERIRMTEEKAAELAAQFDLQYDAMCSTFGDYVYDADGDGKVAILCYDIEDNFPKNAVKYVAGYFWMQDLIDEYGYIGDDFYFGENNYKNGMDCLHIDTFPAMGTDLNDISGCYSTLAHEFQHMLNFSYRVRTAKYIPEMDVYLNEAFSMAAQHLICGAESVSNRAAYIGGAGYTPGTSLCRWTDTLAAYAGSYLFGQYIRVRYAQLGNDGAAIYKKVLESRSAQNTDTLQVIADLLQTDKKQLIVDFWLAVALKQPTGKYGFNGEKWADRINYKLSSYETGRSGIGSGGARFYEVAEQDDALAGENLTFVYFDRFGVNYSASGTAEISNGILTAQITSQTAGSAFAAFYDRQTKQLCTLRQMPLQVGGNQLVLDLHELGTSDCEAKLFLTDCTQKPLGAVIPVKQQ